jgi:hypothetical protein
MAGPWGFDLQVSGPEAGESVVAGLTEENSAAPSSSTCMSEALKRLRA